MRLKPLFDKVIVRPTEDENRPVNGVYRPDTAKEKPQEGVVLATGPGRLATYSTENSPIDHFTPLTVKVGDRVLYGKYSGTEIVVDGEKLLMLREEEIFAIDPGA